VHAWEVGRIERKGKRKAGAKVPTWEDALRLRAKLERATEYHEAELEHAATQRAAARNEVTQLLLLALRSLISHAHFLPKYHCCCNAIEYVWGNGKKRFRITCKYTLKHLREHGLRTLFGIDPQTSTQFCRMGRCYERQLAAGANGSNITERIRAMKKDRLFKSHIRPAPSMYNDI
jgi:transposase